MTYNEPVAKSKLTVLWRTWSPWIQIIHDDVIKWKHFPRYWPFVRGIHRSPVNSPHEGQWRGALMFFFYLRLNKQLSKQSWGWLFEALSRPSWRHCNVLLYRCIIFEIKWLSTDGVFISNTLEGAFEKKIHDLMIQLCVPKDNWKFLSVKEVVME